jgi:peptidoglycan/LPS O-acetylase OafA/YrhL
MRQSQQLTESVWFPAVSGLRFLASLNILLYHMIPFGAFADFKTTAIGRSFLAGSAFHSSFFFILAGFIYYSKYRFKRISRSKLLLSRFRRLYPLYLLMIFLTYALFDSQIQFTFKYLKSLTAHIFLVWPYYPWGMPSINEPGWVVSAFMLCFLVFPELFKWVRQSPKSQLLVSSIVLILVFFLWNLYAATQYKTLEDQRFFHVFPPVRIIEFLLGMMLARVYRSDWTSRLSAKISFRYTTSLLVIIMLIILISNSWVEVYSFEWRWIHHHFFLPLCYLGVLWTVVHKGSVAERFLSTSFFKSMSNDSFYVFLIHMPVLIFFSKVSEIFFDEPKPMSSVSLVIATVLFLYGGSWLVRKWACILSPGSHRQ